MKYFFKVSLILIIMMIILAPNGMAESVSASASGSASASASGAQASSSASASGGGESDSTSSQSSGSSASSTSGATASDSGVTVRSESSPSINDNDDDSSDDSNDNGNNNIEDVDTIYDENEIGVVDCNGMIVSDDPNERCKKIKISIRAEDNTDASGVAITIEEPTIGIEVGEAIAEVAKKEEENTNIITRILKLLNL